MRHIRFRFWDKALKKMLYRKPAYNDFSHPEIIPQQFTGIKDKNGTDIYEGDILKTLHFIDSNKKRHYLYHKVEWCERLTGWQTVAENQDGTEQNGNPQLWVYVKNNEFEVVGNIYEHATELKKEEKIKEKSSTP